MASVPIGDYGRVEVYKGSEISTEEYVGISLTLSLGGPWKKRGVYSLIKSTFGKRVYVKVLRRKQIHNKQAHFTLKLGKAVTQDFQGEDWIYMFAGMLNIQLTDLERKSVVKPRYPHPMNVISDVQPQFERFKDGYKATDF